MGSISKTLPYRLGVDVGGTNTDAVLVDTTASDRSKSVIAAHKTATTSPNVTDGIAEAVRHVLEQSGVASEEVSSLAIGTTHFINAIVEHDHRHLSRVAVVRLSKNFTREIPPFFDFPPGLREIMYGWHTYIDGGLQIDGSEEAPILEEQVVDICKTIRELGLTAVVVCGVFSPLDSIFRQEQRVREIIQNTLPQVSVVCSSEISNLGLLERENASILNASIHKFAQRTIASFKLAMRRLDLRCALYLTQNDGTLIDAHSASQLPIRTFSSGPTNSMRGAAYLSGLYSDNKSGVSSIVCDIGGTTADVGILLPSGYPRQSLANVTIAGVKINYGMPQVESIGIGGGSIVRKDGDQVVVGPDSVGYAIKERALVFGGDTTTATDIAVASGIFIKGAQSANSSQLSQDVIERAKGVIKSKLERVVDLVKTSPQDLDLILVGGGSIIAPDSMQGVNKIIRPPYFDVANAVGAAMSRISASVDIIQDTTSATIKEALQHASELAKEKVIEAGADPATTMITEQEALPLQYLDHRVRTIVKAVGDFAPSHETFTESTVEELNDVEDVKLDAKPYQRAGPTALIDVKDYQPAIQRNAATGVSEWLVSSTDLDWMADGCYVLGCGGGGTPYPEMLKLKRLLQEGHALRVVDVEDLKETAQIYCE